MILEFASSWTNCPVNQYSLVDSLGNSASYSGVAINATTGQLTVSPQSFKLELWVKGKTNGNKQNVKKVVIYTCGFEIHDSQTEVLNFT